MDFVRLAWCEVVWVCVGGCSSLGYVVWDGDKTIWTPASSSQKAQEAFVSYPMSMAPPATCLIKPHINTTVTNLDLYGFILLHWHPSCSTALVAEFPAIKAVESILMPGLRFVLWLFSCFLLVLFEYSSAALVLLVYVFFLTLLIKVKIPCLKYLIPVSRYQRLDRATYSSSGPVHCSLQFMYLLTGICLISSSILSDSDSTSFLNSKYVHCKCCYYL